MRAEVTAPCNPSRRRVSCYFLSSQIFLLVVLIARIALKISQGASFIPFLYAPIVFQHLESHSLSRYTLTRRQSATLDRWPGNYRTNIDIQSLINRLACLFYYVRKQNHQGEPETQGIITEEEEEAVDVHRFVFLLTS